MLHSNAIFIPNRWKAYHTTYTKAEAITINYPDILSYSSTGCKKNSDWFILLFWGLMCLITLVSVLCFYFYHIQCNLHCLPRDANVEQTVQNNLYTHKGVKFHRLVCSCAILILSGILADPKVDIIVKLLIIQALVSLHLKLFLLPAFSDLISMNLSTINLVWHMFNRQCLDEKVTTPSLSFKLN